MKRQLWVVYPIAFAVALGLFASYSYQGQITRNNDIFSELFSNGFALTIMPGHLIGTPGHELPSVFHAKGR